MLAQCLARTHDTKDAQLGLQALLGSWCFIAVAALAGYGYLTLRAEMDMQDSPSFCLIVSHVARHANYQHRREEVVHRMRALTSEHTVYIMAMPGCWMTLARERDGMTGAPCWQSAQPLYNIQ